MAWKEVNIRNDLVSKFFNVSSEPVTIQMEDDKGITWLSYNVLEVGKSQKDLVPTANRRNINYYVFNRGKVDEEAWYEKSQPDNQSNTDISVTSGTSSYSYSTIFNSGELRSRTLGYIIKAIPAIINESESTTDHTLRLGWANDAIKNPNKYLDSFMVVLSSNATARSSGNSISDGDLEWIINSEIKTIATAYEFSAS